MVVRGWVRLLGSDLKFRKQTANLYNGLDSQIFRRILEGGGSKLGLNKNL